MIYITGSYPIHAPIEMVWPRIFDPAASMSLIPGCQQLTETAPGEFRGQIQVGVASISGVYDTLVRVVEQDPTHPLPLPGGSQRTDGRNRRAGSIFTEGGGRIQPDRVRCRSTHYRLAGQAQPTLYRRRHPGPDQNGIEPAGRTAQPTSRRAHACASSGTPIDILEMEGQIMQIVDLTVPIGEDTLSPPSVNLQLKLTSYHRGPTFWQASKVEMLLHTGSHVDFFPPCARIWRDGGRRRLDRGLRRSPGSRSELCRPESRDQRGRPGSTRSRYPPGRYCAGADGLDREALGELPDVLYGIPVLLAPGSPLAGGAWCPGDRLRLLQRVLRPPAGLHLGGFHHSQDHPGKRRTI